MSELDLELVKFRATVRGWMVLPADEGVCVEAPHGDVWVGADGSVKMGITIGASIVLGYQSILTAPRWTLARLLSEPPEGWTNHPDCCGGAIVAVLTWGVADEVRVSAFRLSEGGLDAGSATAPGSGPEGLARLAERHKAAAELAYILAEIQP